ncbi:MAG: lipopolysaccharide biosynthesis protein [Actinomycetia bacterium]|nr:lipopolysaccharide biosynthesis protein [Actinomycetes bacterium]
MLKDILRGAGGDALKYFPVRLVPALTSLVTVPVFTRMVEKTDYGNFYLVNSMTSLAATLATAWIMASVVRFYWAYERRGERDTYVSTIVWSTIGSLVLVSAVAAVVVFAFPGAFDQGVRRLLPIALIGLGVNYLVQVLQQIMRAANRSSAYATLAVASNILATVFGVYFVSRGKMGAFGILLGVVAGNALLVPFGLRNAHSEGSLSPSRFSRNALAEFARFGLPMVPSAISSWMLVLSDRYIIGLTRTAGEVGVYSVAYGLGDKIMGLITVPLLMTMGPVMVQTFEKQGQRLAQDVQTQFTRYFMMAALPLLAGLVAVSQDFMAVFTGEQYRSAYAILPIVSASVLCNGLVQIAGNGIALHKKTTITMTNTIIAAVTQICANLVLVPRFGYSVAAWTTFGSYVVLLSLTWIRSRPFMAWKIPWGDIGRVALAAALMGIAVWGIFSVARPSFGILVAEALTGLLLYAAFLMGVKAVRPDERDFAVELLGKVRSRVLGRRR